MTRRIARILFSMILHSPFMLAALSVLSVSCASVGSSDAESSPESEALTTNYTLLVSASSTRSAAIALNGAHLSGLEYVFTSNASGSINPPGIQQVSYWLDSPSRSGTPTHVEHYTPYDLSGTAGDSTANPWNAANVAAGTHTITQLVTLAGAAGPPQSYTATFTVGGACTPATHCPAGENCGTAPNGCGGTISCGTCAGSTTCGGGGTPNVCGTSSGGRMYSTTFPLTETPISEHGMWVAGSSAGANFGDARTTSGLAFGYTQPGQYSDPTALLTGAWGPEQTVQATARVSGTVPGHAHEVELRLRQTISPGRITGYEVFCSTVVGNEYCNVASWGGPAGVFSVLGGCAGAGSTRYVRDGDVVKATVTGTNPVVITVYINGAQIMQMADTGNCPFTDGKKYGPWTSGNPGIGFYITGDFNWNMFGWSSFTATATP
jgi:hypothetical protein